MGHKNRDEQPNHVFEWMLDGTSKVFPIDYSVNELAKEMRQDNRAVKSHIVQSPLLKDALYQGLRIAPEDEDSEQRGIKKSPLPLEAMTFLKCFFEMREKPEYRALFRTYDKRSRPAVDMERFVVDLCTEMYAQVFPPKCGSEQDTEAYCRHVLFDDDVFNKVVLNKLWSDQITPRIETLQSLAEKAPPDVQLEALGNCLLSLDQCIAMFTGELETHNISDIAREQAVRNMLTQLLSSRAKLQDGAGTYKIENVEIEYFDDKKQCSDMIDMETAFKKINDRFHPSPKSLMEEARRSYLTQLAGSKAASEFERQYEGVHQYLSYIVAPEAITGLRSRLDVWLNDWCCRVIDCCMKYEIIWKVPRLDFSEWKYIGALTNRLAHIYMEKTLKLFDDTIFLVRCYRLIRIYTDWQSITNRIRGKCLKNIAKKLFGNHEQLQQYCDNIDDILKAQVGNPSRQSNISYESACAFSDFLQRAWMTLNESNSKLFDDNHRIVDEQGFTQKFWQMSRNAAKVFGKESFFDYSAQEIEGKLRLYNVIISVPQNILPFGSFLEFCIPMLDGMLLQLLQRIKRDCTETVLDAVTFISRRLSTKRG